VDVVAIAKGLILRKERIDQVERVLVLYGGDSSASDGPILCGHPFSLLDYVGLRRMEKSRPRANA
jgi:hypothetical protein